MILAGFLSIFVLGMRHGADPDHLAAIDNLTRSAFVQRPFWSRFVGAIFAAGHSAMVIVLAALVGLLGTQLTAFSATIEVIGGWMAVAVLVAVAMMNLYQLRSGGALVGLRTRLLPAKLLGSSPLLAFPVGMLFGFGFETSSQIAVYGVALGVNTGVVGAMIVGSMFCLGMIVTDTLDSVLIHRLISTRTSLTKSALRTWIASVSGVALVVAAYEAAQLVGWKPPFPDLAVSGALVVVLLVTFAYVFISATRAGAEAIP